MTVAIQKTQRMHEFSDRVDRNTSQIDGDGDAGGSDNSDDGGSQDENNIGKWV